MLRFVDFIIPFNSVKYWKPFIIDDFQFHFQSYLRYTVYRASSILRHAYFHATPQNLLFAVEFTACRGKTPNCPFFATFISNSRFFGLLFTARCTYCYRMSSVRPSVRLSARNVTYRGHIGWTSKLITRLGSSILGATTSPI